MSREIYEPCGRTSRFVHVVRVHAQMCIYVRGPEKHPPLAVCTSTTAVSACQLREGCVGNTLGAARASPSLSILLSTFSLVRGLFLSCPVSRVFLHTAPKPRPSLQNTATEEMRERTLRRLERPNPYLASMMPHTSLSSSNSTMVSVRSMVCRGESVPSASGSGLPSDAVVHAVAVVTVVGAVAVGVVVIVRWVEGFLLFHARVCLLYTSPSPRD